MKHQKVSVDVWAMVQSMGGYLAVVVLGGVLLRLLVAVVSLPSRLNKQRQNVQEAMLKLQEAMLKLQEKYPEAFKEAMAECSAEKDESEEGNDKGHGGEKEGEGENKGIEGVGEETQPIEEKKTK